MLPFSLVLETFLSYSIIPELHTRYKRGNGESMDTSIPQFFFSVKSLFFHANWHKILFEQRNVYSSLEREGTRKGDSPQDCALKELIRLTIFF